MSTRTLDQIIKDFKTLYSKNQKGHESIKKSLLLFVELETIIPTLPSPTQDKKNVQKTQSTTQPKVDEKTFTSIESVIKKAILSDATPVSILVIQRAICRCMKALYSKHPILMSSTSTRLIKVLQTLSAQRNIQSKYPHVRCILHAIATMYSTNINYMPPISSLNNVFTKLWRFNAEPINVGILTVITSYVENNRAVMRDWDDTFKFCKMGSTDQYSRVRAAAGKCAYAIARKIEYDSETAKVDQLIATCLKGCDDEDRNVRFSFGTAAGHLMYAVVPPAGKEPKPTKSKKHTKMYIFSTALMTLTGNFAKYGSSRYLREGITISVIYFLKQFQKSVLESNMDLMINHFISLLGNQKVFSSTNEQVQVQYFISHIIRYGVTFNTNEVGRLLALSELCKLVKTYLNNQFALVCICREISYMCHKLGEVAVQKRDEVLEAVLLCLKQPQDYVRYVGSLCIRALAEAIPTQTSFLISALLNMVQMDHAEMATSNTNEIQFANSIHGHATALGALISTNLKGRQDLSINHSLCSAALDTAALLIGHKPKTNPYVIMRRQEACWVIVSATMSLSEHWINLNLEKIMDLWDIVLGPKAKSPFEKNEREYELRCKASALLSLKTFITKCPNLLSSERLKVIFKYIESIIMIPSRVLLEGNNKQQFNFITKMAFAEADGTTTKIKTSLIDEILDEKDKNMENLEDVNEKSDYFIFQIEKALPFEADASSVLRSSYKFFFQAQGNSSINVRVVDSAIKLLARLFPYHKTNSRNQIIDHLILQMKTVNDALSDSEYSSIVYSNVVACVYGILRTLIIKKVPLDDKAFLINIHAILNASLGHLDNSIRKAAAVSMGYLGHLLGETVIQDLIKRCGQKIQETGPLRAGYALALGHVNYSLGSITTSGYLPSTVSLLQALARANSVGTQTAALHALWYTVDSAGYGFAAHIDTVQQLLSTLIFSPREHDTHLLIGSARILHAHIGALGPEMMLHEHLVNMFSFYLHDFLTSESESVHIEAVSLIERAIALVPKLVELDYVLPFLRKFLSSTNSKLRETTASCIRVIAKTHANEISQSFPIELLIRLMDDSYYDKSEHISELTKFVLEEMCYPVSAWINLIKDVVSSHPMPKEQPKLQGLSDEIDNKETTEVPKENHIYSWQTKVFALKMLKLLLEVYSKDMEHIDLALARKAKENNPDGDYLVFHLDKMIDTCNTAITKGSPTTRYHALLTLKTIIEKFGNVMDPDVPEETILEHNAARFSAAIAQGFDSSTPFLISAACDLASVYIPSKMLRNQPKTMSRIVTTITKHLPNITGIKFSEYGDVPATKVKLTILSSLAEIYIAAEESKNDELLNILKPFYNELLTNWKKVLQDFALLMLLHEEQVTGVEQIKIEKFSPTFFEEGTQKQVYTIYITAFSSLINATSRIRIELQQFEDTPLILGLAVKALHSLDMKKVGPACLKALARVVTTQEFLSSPIAKGACFEIFVLLIKIQQYRFMELQMAALYLLKTVILHTDRSFFTSGSLPIDSIVNAAIEVCLKPIRLHFPPLFEQDSEHSLNFEITLEQKNLINECMNCLNSIIKRLSINTNGGSIITILYTICRVLQYTKAPSCIDVATTLAIEVQKTPTGQNLNISVWTVAFCAAIDSLQRRIQQGIIRSHYEVELMFISMLAINELSEAPNLIIATHEKVMSTLTQALDYKNLSEEKNFQIISWILQGVQNGVVKLAQAGYSALAIHYLGKLSSQLIALLVHITQRPNKDKPETTSLVDTSIIPCCINILLAAFSLVDTDNRISFLSIMIPSILLLFRYCNAHRSSEKKRLHKLCVQCLERLGSMSPNEFKQTVQILPPTAVKEMQDAVIQSKQPKQKKVQTHQNLSINFKAFRS